MVAVKYIVVTMLAIFVVMSAIASFQSYMVGVSYDFTKINLDNAVNDVWNRGTMIVDERIATPTNNALKLLTDRIESFTFITAKNTAQTTLAGKVLWFVADLMNTSLKNLGIDLDKILG